MAPSLEPTQTDGINGTKKTNGANGTDGLKLGKTREMSNHHMDSTVWNDVKLRDDDIIIATYAKSGTTWLQQIVSQLIFKGDPTIPAGALSPWVDLRVVPRDVMLGMVEAQQHRRFLKTHLPREAMVWDPKVKYLFIARDGRDMIWSLHHHLYDATPAFYQMFEKPGFEGPPLQRPTENPRDLFIGLLDDTLPMWPYWNHIRSWWEVRHESNVKVLHYNDLKANLEDNIREIAKFLEVDDITEDKWKDIIEHCSFSWMKEHAELAAPPGSEIAWENGAKDFVYKGTNSRWKDTLSEEDCEKYLAKARKELGEEAANWLQNGGPIA